MNATHHLQALLGSNNFFSHVSYDGLWALRSSEGVWLLAHELHGSTEESARTALESGCPRVLNTVDPSLVPTAAAVFGILRKPLLEIEIIEDGSLVLGFADDTFLLAASSVKEVDWQWAITRGGMNPYSDFEVACFGPRDVRVSVEHTRTNLESS